MRRIIKSRQMTVMMVISVMMVMVLMVLMMMEMLEWTRNLDTMSWWESVCYPRSLALLKDCVYIQFGHWCFNLSIKSEEEMSAFFSE